MTHAETVAQCDGLHYQLYYADKGEVGYIRTYSFTGDTYSLNMTEVRDGRTIFCTIRDKYGSTVSTQKVQLRMIPAVKITRQPVSVKAEKGETAKVTLVAQGEGLTFQWYYANEGSDTFTRTTAFRGGSYSVTMTEARDGRRVYCVITDQYGKKVKSQIVTLSIG